MKNFNKENSSIYHIDSLDFLRLLYERKSFILLSIFIGSLLSGIWAFSLPDLYTTKSKLAIVNTQDEYLNQSSRYQTVTGIMGFGLPNASDSRANEAIASLTTFKFFNEHFLPNIFLPNLMAVSYWDKSTNKIYYDDNLYDLKSNIWKYQLENHPPSAQQSFLKFLDIFKVSQDRETGFVNIEIIHYSPYIAKEWLGIIIKEINFLFRENQRSKSNSAIKYLSDQIQETNLAETKLALSSLIQNEVKMLTLIEVNEDFIFRAIDPPIAPENKSSPNRFTIMVLGLLIGFFIGILSILLELSLINYRKRD